MYEQLLYLRQDIKRFFPNESKPTLRQCIRLLSEQRFYAILIYRFGRLILFEAKGGIFLLPLKILYILLNKIILEVLFGMYITADCNIGPGLYIANFQGLAINPTTHIGKNCTISHGVIIATAADGTSSGTAKIGDNVFIGARAVIIGGITIGDNVRIGANAVVTRDVPSNVTVVGVPAKILKQHA